MAALDAAGNRAEALRAYQRARRVLADQLGVDPSEDTEAAYLALLGPTPAARPRRRTRRAGGRRWCPRAAAGVGPFPSWGATAELELLAAGMGAGVARGPPRRRRDRRGGHRQDPPRQRGRPARRRRAAARCCSAAATRRRSSPTSRSSRRSTRWWRRPRPTTCPRSAPTRWTSWPPSFPASGAWGARPGRPRPTAAGCSPPPPTSWPPLAAERPVLLVLDDLQWADDDTLLLLRHLLRRAGSAPVLVVAVSRDHDLDPGSALADVVHALDRDGWVDRVPLRGLDERDVGVLLAHLLGAGDHRDAARRMVAETAGNPFLVTELGHASAAGRDPRAASPRGSRTSSRPASPGSTTPSSTCCRRAPSPGPRSTSTSPPRWPGSTTTPRSTPPTPRCGRGSWSRRGRIGSASPTTSCDARSRPG